MLHSCRLQPYTQTLGNAGKACQGQTHYLFTKIRKFRRKSFITLGPDQQPSQEESKRPAFTEGHHEERVRQEGGGRVCQDRAAEAAPEQEEARHRLPRRQEGQPRQPGDGLAQEEQWVRLVRLG